eukprot:CAMPEP_0174257138 /NCGR_PEP_ID=MMETSP0439-20130205/6304_1 /TAXON_ID=0 /ORGANISM="Stereomyxa ramosa, Strain Chinc5" /LENGTH=638 /DNA_ID=CAMNT_0015340079 /DNA_START=740 /DNA_END=2657 /DNA_ORIENTATION=+
MVVLDRLAVIQQHHSKILQPLVMDMLSVLSTPDMDVRKKTLGMIMALVSIDNIVEIIFTLKKQVTETRQSKFDKMEEYRHLLIVTIHSCAVKFPSIAAEVVQVLMDYLGDPNVPAAMEVVMFIREVVDTYPEHRESIIPKLQSTLKYINSSPVYRSALWILGEYSETLNQIDTSFLAIHDELGKFPFIKEVDENENENEEEEEKHEDHARTNAVGVILPDGTYATQSPLTADIIQQEKSEGGKLRALLLNGDFYLASALANTFTKLFLRSLRNEELDKQQKNILAVDVMLVIVEILKLGQTLVANLPIDPDSFSRIKSCLYIINHACNYNPKHILIHDAYFDELRYDAELVEDIYLTQCRFSFSQMLLEKQKSRQKALQKETEEKSCQPDRLIHIRQLGAQRGPESKKVSTKKNGFYFGEKEELELSRLHQLTGLSDPIYAEAIVNVNKYDIVLEVLVVNQTPDTLQNLNLELATLGDLKLSEKPREQNVAPFGEVNIRAVIKVAASDNSVIFGTLVYDIGGKAASSTNNSNLVFLNDIHIDIMDYINPATCNEVQFRTLWSQFEWENRITVDTTIEDLQDYFTHILETTNMNCLTRKKRLEGDCDFISANLYATSVFGEDVLANVSIEKTDGKKKDA